MYGGLIALRVLARKYEFKADVSGSTRVTRSNRSTGSSSSSRTNLRYCIHCVWQAAQRSRVAAVGPPLAFLPPCTPGAAAPTRTAVVPRGGLLTDG
jgi:hypothetical protein